MAEAQFWIRGKELDKKVIYFDSKESWNRLLDISSRFVVVLQITDNAAKKEYESRRDILKGKGAKILLSTDSEQLALHQYLNARTYLQTLQSMSQVSVVERKLIGNEMGLLTSKIDLYERDVVSDITAIEDTPDKESLFPNRRYSDDDNQNFADVGSLNDAGEMKDYCWSLSMKDRKFTIAMYRERERVMMFHMNRFVEILAADTQKLFDRVHKTSHSTKKGIESALDSDIIIPNKWMDADESEKAVRIDFTCMTTLQEFLKFLSTTKFALRRIEERLMIQIEWFEKFSLYANEENKEMLLKSKVVIKKVKEKLVKKEKSMEADAQKAKKEKKEAKEKERRKRRESIIQKLEEADVVSVIGIAATNSERLEVSEPEIQIVGGGGVDGGGAGDGVDGGGDGVGAEDSVGEEDEEEEQEEEEEEIVENEEDIEENCSEYEELEYDVNTKRHNRYIDLMPGAYDINLKCNEFKEEVNQLRKRCMKALAFCSNLVDDLSLAAKFTIHKNRMQYTLDQLKQSHHALVHFINPELLSSQPRVRRTRDSQLASDGAPFMIFVPQGFAKDKIQIARLLFLISAKDDYETKETDSNEKSFESTSSSSTLKNSRTSKSIRRMVSSNSFLESSEESQRGMLNELSKLATLSKPSRTASPNSYMLSPQTNTDGYLLYLKIPNKMDETWEWTGEIIDLFAALPVRRALYQHKNVSDTSDDVSKQASLILVVPRPKLLDKVIKNELRTRFKASISLAKEKTSFHPNIEYAIDEVKESILNLRAESARSIRSIEKDLKTHYDTPIWIKRKSPITYQRYLSEIWRVSYNFGIDLQNECIKFKTHDQEEQFIQGLADFCIMWCEYILDKTERGKGKTVQPWAARKGIQLLQEAFHLSTSLTDTEYVKLRNSVEKCLSHVIGDRTNSPSLPSTNSTTTTTTTEMLTRNTNMNKNMSPSMRFSQACMLADKKREHSLQDKRYIGKILDAQREQNIITATEVNFRWQLGLKIGEGQYGTVYSCVNLDTGEPMAMKEIPFKSNDVEAIKNIYSEINNLQGIRHENLVRLYGSELHRKEMYVVYFIIFTNLDRVGIST